MQLRSSQHFQAPKNVGGNINPINIITQMGYWCTLHLFDDKKFYKEVVPILKGETGDLTADCLEFLKFHVVGGISHLSQQEVSNLVEQTIEKIISISNSLDSTFKINSEYQKIKNYDNQITFLNNLEGLYDFNKFFEYYIFKTCADFFPHLTLGKGGVSRNFKIPIKTLSETIIGELDDWNYFFCYDTMGIKNWITNEDLKYIYLDKEHLHYNDNERAEAFLSLLEIAHNNELGFIIGVDMSEHRLKLLPVNKTVKPETWTTQNSSGLLWEL